MGHGQLPIQWLSSPSRRGLPWDSTNSASWFSSRSPFQPLNHCVGLWRGGKKPAGHRFHHSISHYSQLSSKCSPSLVIKRGLLENLPLDSMISPIILHVLGYFPAMFEPINIVPQGLKEGKKSSQFGILFLITSWLFMGGTLSENQPEPEKDDRRHLVVDLLLLPRFPALLPVRVGNPRR